MRMCDASLKLQSGPSAKTPRDSRLRGSLHRVVSGALKLGQREVTCCPLSLRTIRPHASSCCKPNTLKVHLWNLSSGHAEGSRNPERNKSVEPKVRLQGYGYNPFCSHSSRCLAVLVWQYFDEAFCAPKVRLKWYGFKGFPSHSSHCSGGLFPQHSGVSPIKFHRSSQTGTLQTGTLRIREKSLEGRH